MKKIGFIGLGIMGKPMAKNLRKAGYEVVVYDVRPEAVAELVQAGAAPGTSPKDVAARSEVIITMLPNSPEVKEVALGVIAAINPGLTAGVIHCRPFGLEDQRCINDWTSSQGRGWRERVM